MQFEVPDAKREKGDEKGTWLGWMNTTPAEQEQEEIRKSIERGRPLGKDTWMKRTAAAMGLESSLRARSRPRKEE